MKIINFLMILFVVKCFNLQQFECTNGRDPKGLSDQEYLIEFSKGNCSPVMVVPPLTGVRLYFQITNCELFQQENSEAFKTCGWTHCKKKFYEFWKSVPSKEYALWVSNLLTPMSMISPLEWNSDCFAALINVKVDFSKKPENSLIETKGYKILYQGQTPGTRDKGKCGKQAINQILPDSIGKLVDFQLWGVFFQELDKRGYRNGLTYQAVPYDFRLSITNNQLNKIFQPNLERIFKITGKKVYILTLSYGVNNSYYQITKLSKDQKKMIKGLIGMGGNFTGIPEADFCLLTAIGQYGIGAFKLHFKGALFFQTHLISVYENGLKNPYKIFKGEKFMEEVKKRMDYENGLSEKDESIYSKFLPNLQDKCTPEQYEFFGNTCKLNLQTEDQAVMIIDDVVYTRKTIGDLHKKFTPYNDTYKYWKEFQDHDFNQLTNPQVPMILLTLRTSITAATYKIDEDIRQKIKNKQYLNPKVAYTYGDGTVDSLSLFLAPLKWAYEYDTKSVEDAQPVKIIDVCGTYNQKQEIYDEVDKNGEKIFNKNEFIGMECECMNDINPSSCNHSGMFRDKYTGYFFTKLIITNEVSYSKEYEKMIYQMNPEELRLMTVDDCPQVRDNQQFFVNEFLYLQ